MIPNMADTHCTALVDSADRAMHDGAHQALMEGPDMLNPVVLLPLPLALLLLTLVAYAAARYLDSLPVFPDWNMAPQPRHRLANAPTAYRPRPWDDVTAEVIPISAPPAPPAPFDPLDHRVPLAEVERWGSIPDDWYQPLMDPKVTGELATIA